MAVLADTDSRWKWGVNAARQLSPTAELDAYLLDGPAAASHRQIAESGIDPQRVVVVDAAAFLAAIQRRVPEVLILALPGGGCQAMLHALAALWPSGHRPIVVTGYVGVVYEKLVEGLLSRAGADIVLANSPYDLERFRAVCADASADPAAIVATRLPFLEAGSARPDPERPFTVTFAAQPGVPGSRADREYVVARLADHARLFPQREVLIKLRSLPGERMTHSEQFPYADLVRALGSEVPANLRVVHGSMGQVLDRTDLLVTVSSTAAMESLHRGIATLIITDFGIRESLGNPYFLGSGCLASFDALDDGWVPIASGHWQRHHGLGDSAGTDFADRVSSLLAAGAPSPLRPYFDARLSPVYLARLLARYGLDPSGRPVVRAEATGEVRRFVRRAIRTTARTVYHHGVSRVAPALRRLGSL